MPDPLRCPACGYDLTSAAGESITCPECGRATTRAEARRTLDATVSFALATLGIAALGFVGVSVLARGLYSLSRGDGMRPNVGEARLAFQIVPAVLLAGAIAALARRAGFIGARWAWPAAFAALFAVVTTYQSVAPLHPPLSAFPGWAQPGAVLRGLAPWLRASEGLAVLGGAWVLLRIPPPVGAGTARAIRTVLVAGAAMAVLTILGRAHADFFLEPALTVPGQPPPRPQTQYPPFLLSRQFGHWFPFLHDMLAYFAWTALGVLAFYIRALRSAAPAHPREA